MVDEIIKQGKAPPKVIREIQSGVGAFRQAVTRAEELSKIAREAAEGSIKESAEAMRRAEEVSGEAKKAADESKKASRESLRHAEDIVKAT